MKKTILSLLFVLTAVFVNAKVIDNSDFTVTIPSSWLVEPSTLSYPISSMLSTATESGSEMVMVGVYEVEMDPATFLQHQVLERQNQFFASAKNFSSMRNERLGGVDAKAIDFEVAILGSDYKGTAYAAKVSVGTGFVFRCNRPSVSAPQGKSILASLKFKDNVATENKPLSERLQEFSQLVAKQKLMIGEGLQFAALNVDNQSRTLVYVYKYLNYTTADINPAEMQKIMESALLEAFQEDVTTSSLVREAADAGYTFCYRGVDKNDNRVFYVKLTYGDYKHLLR